MDAGLYSITPSFVPVAFLEPIRLQRDKKLPSKKGKLTAFLPPLRGADSGCCLCKSGSTVWLTSTLAAACASQWRRKRLRTQIYALRAFEDVRKKFSDINEFAEVGDIQSAEHLFNEIESDFQRGPWSRKKRMLFNTMIKACANAAEPSRAESWYEKLLADGITPNKETFGKLSEASAKAGDPDRATFWFDECKSRGLRNDRVGMNILLDAAAKGPKPDQAKVIFDRISEQRQPDARDYGAVIQAYAWQGDGLGAEEWLTTMTEARVEPDARYYTAIIHAWRHDQEKAEHWFLEMIRRGIQPTVFNFNTILKACARAGQLVKAEAYFYKMQEFHITPDVVSGMALVEACKKDGQYDRAKMWLDWMVAAGMIEDQSIATLYAQEGNAAEVEKIVDAGLVPDEASWHAIILAHARKGDIQTAMDQVEKMIKTGLTPDVLSFNCILTELQMKRDLSMTETVVERMRDIGVEHDEQTDTIVRDTLGDAWATELIGDPRKRATTRNPSSLSDRKLRLRQQQMALAGRKAKENRALREIRKEKPKPNPWGKW
eukprot:TRINITY_DN4824_c0_g2_i1.p1 TRINITY_DN4824_c0_g2~~TRINITY_DN4824_c0_g2_i1.p1  ORF type:complete len:546 (+),score=75.49 TRINITY_DN4824_c0_g2_i1:143-1780(+)